MSFMSALALRQHMHQIPLKSGQEGSTRKKKMKKEKMKETDNEDDCYALDFKIRPVTETSCLVFLRWKR